jgi:hypothetical protein
LEDLERVSGRIAAEITSEKDDFARLLTVLGTIVWTIENLIRPFDRAHRFVLRTPLEHSGDVSGRMAAGNARIYVSEVGNRPVFPAAIRPEICSKPRTKIPTIGSHRISIGFQ